MSEGAASPRVVILAGPNGAGKSTVAPFLLHDQLAVAAFVNADAIAAGLSAFAPESVAMRAGRLMLGRLDELARNRATFAFETTLATRSFAPRLDALRAGGYCTHVVFLALRSPEAAIARVAARVARGGHHVPDEVVRRRFERGLRNFFRLYAPQAAMWELYDASGTVPRLVASQSERGAIMVDDEVVWRQLRQMVGER